MKAESLAKVYVLTHGVNFTEAALQFADVMGAKRQNMVYNLPKNEKVKDVHRLLGRPQELFLGGHDGYIVCASAVSPVLGRASAIVDYSNGNLTIKTPAMPAIGRGVALVEYVQEPAYYNKLTTRGGDVKRTVSACGYDEMNIWPWHDCMTSQKCSFCGINSVNAKNEQMSEELLSAAHLARQKDPFAYWGERKSFVVEEIIESVDLAIDDPCYEDEVHLILITGNLCDRQLNLQAQIYADIALELSRKFPNRFKEGIIAVSAPPQDESYLNVMKRGGIDIVVFNLEVFGEAEFKEQCPGKSAVGRDHYMSMLEKSVEIFGRGKVWTNFVLGLEDYDQLLQGCESLARKGIVSSANVLHIDHGSGLTVVPPNFDDVISFYNRLADIYKQYDMNPFYCSKALRTSVSNEAFAGRFSA